MQLVIGFTAMALAKAQADRFAKDITLRAQLAIIFSAVLKDLLWNLGSVQHPRIEGA